MTKQEYIKIVEERWESLQALKSESSFYDYEKKFDEMMVELGRELLEKNLGEVPRDRRKKKK